jgi:hypothetical protein
VPSAVFNFTSNHFQIMTTQNITDFRENQRRRAAENALNDLKNHSIVQIHRDGDPGRIWKCSRNGSSVYAFTVCAPPGWLIVYGDMGECMWSRHRDMLAFIRGSIGSLDYFSEKASKDCKIREPYTELAEEWLAEQESGEEWEGYHGEPMSDEDKEKLQEIREAYERYNSIENLIQAAYESGLYDSTSYLPQCEYYTYHYLWKIEALKWFIAKIDAGEFTKASFAWEDQADLYLLQNLQSCTGSYVGNSPCFWHKDGIGYTPWIDDAKRWTKEEAELQIRSTRGSHTWKMWPLSEITAAAKVTVDIQDLRK